MTTQVKIFEKNSFGDQIVFIEVISEEGFVFEYGQTDFEGDHLSLNDHIKTAIKWAKESFAKKRLSHV